ncbi:hypothetical protein V4R08_07500 [Nitrobacter sp. NHB1]|uniref:hypothetical protein n=1 Tax=Nitrobacter sp. NHB1 TaxID=3119830 RepID=UPI002FFFE4E4
MSLHCEESDSDEAFAQLLDCFAQRKIGDSQFCREFAMTAEFFPLAKRPEPAYLHRNTVDGGESGLYNRATFGKSDDKMRNFVTKLVLVIVVPWSTARDG